MLSSYGLNQLRKLAESHPQYFLHNYRKELANAGYEEVSDDPTPEPVQAAPKGHGKKVLSGASLIKGKPKALADAEVGSRFLAEGSDQYDLGKGLKDG